MRCSVASYTSFTDGSRNSNNVNVVPFGVDQRKLDKYVFRAGFKIPKHVQSPLVVNSSSVNDLYAPNYYDDDGSVGSLGSSSVTSGRSRPHTVAFNGRGKGRQYSPKRDWKGGNQQGLGEDKLPEVTSPASRGM